MNNEIGRKITSLTLMTIMLAGGMVIAAPSMMPVAHAANANLFVSAENSQFDNYMSGPQVIEVVVIDSDINDTDEAKGEPDVTVNGKILRMVQAVDGNWYGYFADRIMSQIADSTAVPDSRQGLDFGTFCSATSAGDQLDGAGSAAIIDFSDTNGVAIPMTGLGDEGSPTGDPITADCSAATGTDITPTPTLPRLNVVREAKEVNTTVTEPGQIDVDPNFWPFVQLYTLNPTGNVVIQYNKGGGVQTTTLTFDSVDEFASAGLDRVSYTPGSEVHATITDLWLNIDPTDEDSWTFGTTGFDSDDDAITAYQVFDENGNAPGDIGTNTDDDLTNQLGNLMCEDNCRLLTNADVQNQGFVITLQDNDDSRISGDPNGPTPLVAGLGTPTMSFQNPTSFQTEATLFQTGGIGNVPVTITEQGPNSGVFGTYDEADTSNIVITKDAKRGTSASITYNEDSYSILVSLGFGNIDIQPIDDEWSSGEEIPIELFDIDANRNSRADEDLDLFNTDVKLIPSLGTGNPFTLSENDDNDGASLDVIFIDDVTLVVDTGNAIESTPLIADASNEQSLNMEVQKFSKRGLIDTADTADTYEALFIDLDATAEDLKESISDPTGNFHGFNLLNIDVRSITGDDVNVWLVEDGVVNDDLIDIATPDFNDSQLILLAENVDSQSLTLLQDPTDPGAVNQQNDARDAIFALSDNTDIGLLIEILTPATVADEAIVADFFSFGFDNDGLESEERIANQLIRLELEETGDNTSTFAGTLEYTMINQLNILDPRTYADLATIDDEATFIVIEDLTDEDSPRVNYLDLGADGVSTQVADQEEAPSHSGIVSFDLDTYKVADTVIITVEDLDLNVDSDLIDIYTTVSESTIVPNMDDRVGDDRFNITFSNGEDLGRVLDVTFDDELWTASNEDICTALLDTDGIDTGLADTGFTLIETDRDSGTFIGDFQIPSKWCAADDSSPSSTTGLDIEVNYVDFRDASGEFIEVGDSAGVRANTGSVSLDRTVYPVPFGVPDNFDITASDDDSPDNRSIFAIHETGINEGTNLATEGNYLTNGDLIIHVRVNDPDFDISASGEDNIAQNRSDLPVGPVEISILRGSDTVILGYAGGPNTIDGTINVGDDLVGNGMVDSVSELTIIDGGEGFDDTIGVPTEITISQTGTPTPTSATASFTNLGTGEIDESELTILSSASGFASGVVTLDQSSSGAAATATFTDKNSDTNVELTELEDIVHTSGATLFDDTVGVPSQIEISQGALDAFASFTDDTDSINLASELDSIIFDGEDFTTGTVTLTQAANPGATATAEFVDIPTVNQFGPIDEIAPDAGIFEVDVTIKYTDGPADVTCPTTLDFDASTAANDSELTRFSSSSVTGENYCILQGDILQVEYTDPTDASGDPNTVTDSATFDLRNGVLQSDKSVYIIGSDMILTLIEPDLDLDNDQAETWDLDLIEWDSDAATVTMGNADGQEDLFDPEPLNFRETGDSTGIFQIVIEIPEELDNDNLERGEEIILEYTDWGPSGSDFVGDEDEDVNVTLFTSNFGATVELDQKVYTWTDKVYMTIVAPDHNFDGDLIDEIGNTDDDPIKISTRGFDLDNYKLVETGTDTGIFTGEVILTGFSHDADGKGGDTEAGFDTNPRTTGEGPTDGFLQSDDDDGLTVSFEFSEDETIVGSSLIRWNIGEVQWLEASYPASGTGVVRVIDPDMNLDPEAVDNFDVDVWSDSDAGGIDLTVTETNEATGIFEGTVFFTVTDESSGHRLRVAEGDTVTAEYEDNTLPDPYTTADELDITATSLIGTIVPPLERAPAASLRTVDAFGNTLDSISVDQQVQISADLANGQDREQAFAYLVQIQDGNGVTVALAWITGSLAPGQSFSPALSWIPTQAGTYTATAFVWESIDNPTALSPPVSTTITVR